MKNTGNLKVTTASDREIAMTRIFNAPRCLVFDACPSPNSSKNGYSGRRVGKSRSAKLI
jgi:hypothetical protein